MMKRNILTVVVPAILSAGAANAAEVYNKDGNKLELYGRANAVHYFSDDFLDGDMSYVRFGFKGETQITDQLIGYGQWEYNVIVSNSELQGDEGNATRLGFAGLKFSDGSSFDYGRNYGVMYDIESWTDFLPEFGGDSYSNADSFMVQRANGVATFRNNNFFGLVEGLNFALQYQGKNENDFRNPANQNGDGYGLAATYSINPSVSIGGAYATSKRTKEQNNGTHGATGERADSWTVGTKYDANNIYLAAIYAETRNMTPYGDIFNFMLANKTQAIELVAQYQFDFGLRPSIAYVQSKGKDLGHEGVDGNKTVNKYIDLGATYSFNKNMSTYVDYRLNLLDKNDFTESNGVYTDNVLALGLVYQF